MTPLTRIAIVAALFVGSMGSCSDPSAPPPRTGFPEGPRTPGVHIITGESISDTALAFVAQPLVVRVRGLDGEPLAGVVLQARALAHDTLPSRLSMAVAPAFAGIVFSSNA